MNVSASLSHREFSLLEWMKKSLMQSFREIGTEFGENSEQYILGLDGLTDPSVFSSSFPISKAKIEVVKEFVESLEKKAQQSMFDNFHPHGGWEPEDVIATLSILKLQGLVESTKSKRGYRITKDGLNALTYSNRA